MLFLKLIWPLNFLNSIFFFATGLDGEKKLTFFSAAMQEMKHQGFDFRRRLYLEEDTFNAKKREIIFFLIFIKFSIRSAVLLTVYIDLSFYFSLRGKNIRTSKLLTTSPQPYAEKKKSRCFCFKKIVATNWEFFCFLFFVFFSEKIIISYTRKPHGKWMCTQDLLLAARDFNLHLIVFAKYNRFKHLL